MAGISQVIAIQKRVSFKEALFYFVLGGLVEMQRKINLNVKFNGESVLCAKSPEQCMECKDKNKCENMDFYYYPFGDIEKVMSERSYTRHKGALKQKG